MPDLGRINMYSTTPLIFRYHLPLKKNLLIYTLLFLYLYLSFPGTQTSLRDRTGTCFLNLHISFYEGNIQISDTTFLGIFSWNPVHITVNEKNRHLLNKLILNHGPKIQVKFKKQKKYKKLSRPAYLQFCNIIRS
jgi:hypothetical protein